jgi:uncharacterized protein (DUF433 family)
MALPIVLVPHPHVRVDSKVLGGSPHVVGSRVLVRRLYAFYKNGTRIETILKRYPQIGPAKLFDALAFALDNLEVIEADLEQERQMLERSGAPIARSGPADQIELPFAKPAPATVRSAGRAKPSTP